MQITPNLGLDDYGDFYRLERTRELIGIYSLHILELIHQLFSKVRIAIRNRILVLVDIYIGDTLAQNIEPLLILN